MVLFEFSSGQIKAGFSGLSQVMGGTLHELFCIANTDLSLHTRALINNSYTTIRSTCTSSYPSCIYQNCITIVFYNVPGVDPYVAAALICESQNDLLFMSVSFVYQLMPEISCVVTTG